MRTILSRLLFYLELNKTFHWLSSYNRFYFLSEKFLFYDARFPAMTNFNSDFNKIILSKVSCNREIETNDKNAAVDRTYAHDGNVESHTAESLGHSIRSCTSYVAVRSKPVPELFAGGAPWLERNDACSRTISLAWPRRARTAVRRKKILWTIGICQYSLHRAIIRWPTVFIHYIFAYCRHKRPQL